MGKGSGRRPCRVSRDEEYHRWLLATDKIAFEEFEVWYKTALRNKKIRRDGKIING